MSDIEEIDTASIVQQARLSLSDTEYRRKYRVADFLELSPKQREFLNSTAIALFFKSGNQCGKTTAVADMIRAVALQAYRPLYVGWRQPKLNLVRPHSCVIWCFSTQSQMTRDGLQSRLLGDVDAGMIGTGLIPAEAIVSVQKARGIAGLVDSVVVRRADGTTAVIRFKSYEQGRGAAQSESCDLVCCDELPDDMELWLELLSRGTATLGRIVLTATPNMQMNPVVQWFKEPNHPERETITATIDDALHMTEEMREGMKQKFKNNPAAARTKLYGQEFSGGGMVFCTPMANYVWDGDPADQPSYFRHIIGFDPSHGGLSESAHPAGVVFCSVDPDTQTLFVLETLRLKNALPETLVASILQTRWGAAPVAWGAAENQGTGGAAESYANMFRRLGLRMLGSHATLPGGGVALDPQIDLIESMMRRGKLRINRRCHDLFEELQAYERDEKTGKPIALRDDLIAALRYAVLCVKSAKVPDPDHPRYGIYRGVPLGGTMQRKRDRSTSYFPDGDPGPQWGE